MTITLISVKVTGMAIKESQRSDNERLKMRRFLRKLCLILRVAARSRNYLVPLNKWGPGCKSGCLAFLSRGRRRTARSTARFSQAPTEICLFQFLFCDAVLYWARPESCIFCHFLTMYPGPVIILMWLHLWWKRCRWSGWPSSLREGGWSGKKSFYFYIYSLQLNG